MPTRTGKQVVIAVFPDPPPIPAETLSTATLVIEEVVGAEPPRAWRLVQDTQPSSGWNPSWGLSDEGATGRVFQHVRRLQGGTADDPPDEATTATVARLEALVDAHPDDDMTEVLDGLVHDILSQQASSINNEGHSSQLAFLLDSGLAEGEIAAALHEMIVTAQGTYTVAVYFLGDDYAWHHYGNWQGKANFPAAARAQALDELRDERIEDWRAEVTDFDPEDDDGEE